MSLDKVWYFIQQVLANMGRRVTPYLHICTLRTALRKSNRQGIMPSCCLYHQLLYQVDWIRKWTAIKFQTAHVINLLYHNTALKLKKLIGKQCWHSSRVPDLVLQRWKPKLSMCTSFNNSNKFIPVFSNTPQIAKFMGSTWGPAEPCRPQMGPMLAPWTLLSGAPSIETCPCRVELQIH